MLRKRHSAEEIVAKLRQADVLLAQGQTGADVARVLSGSMQHDIDADGIVGKENQAVVSFL